MDAQMAELIDIGIEKYIEQYGWPEYELIKAAFISMQKELNDLNEIDELSDEQVTEGFISKVMAEKYETENIVLKNALDAISSGFGGTKLELENYAEQALIVCESRGH